MNAHIAPDLKKDYLDLINTNLGIMSQREIARRLGIGKTTVNRWAKENLGFEFKKHTVDESFFDKFEEKSAYLFGFICADGNIAWNPKKGYQTLTITSSEKDWKHIEKMRKLLKSTKPLLYSPKTRSYRLIVNNKYLIKKLMKLGVKPRKTLTIEFPKKIEEKYLKHFVRGIIDGDGNVRYVDRKRSPYFEITIASGSTNFCIGLVKAIERMIKVKANIRKAGKNTYVIQYSCSRGEKLAEFIYDNATIFLERKYVEYKKRLRRR